MMRTILCLFFSLVPLVCAAQQSPRVVIELEETRTIVGQPLTVRIKALVPTFSPKPPEFPSMEVPGLLVRLPERASRPITERIDGETWSGVQRLYRLYPLQPGDFEIPAQTVRVTYAKPGGIEPIVEEIDTEALRFEAVVPTAAASLSPLIIAQSFELSQTLEVPDDLAVGDAIVRTVEARIGGTTAILIPQLIPLLESDALRTYPKEPVVSESEDNGRLSGSKTEAATYLVTAPGEATLGALHIDWFNLDTGQVETASVEGRSFTIAGEAASSATEALDWRQLVGSVAVGLLILWILRKTWPALVQKLAELKARWTSSEPYAFRTVMKAIRKRDLNLTYAALLQWLDHFPDASQNTLQPALERIGSKRFSNSLSEDSGDPWHALRVAVKTLRSESRNAARRHSENALKPLNPFS